MAVRKFNPITPGMRHKVLSKFDNITTDKPHKPLLEPLKKRGGRNNDGKMTMRYRGGGHKRMYRVIDFKRDKHGVGRRGPHDRVRSEPQRPHCADQVRRR